MKFLHMLGAAAICLGVMGEAAVAADARIADGGARLRSGPGTSYAVLTGLPGGVNVKLHGCPGQGSWCRIGVSGRRGWVARSRLATYSIGRTGDKADGSKLRGDGTPYVRILGRVTDRPGYCYALSHSGDSIIVKCP